MVSDLWLIVWHSVRHHALRIYRLLFLADGMLFTASMAPSLAIRRTRWSVVPSKIPDSVMLASSFSRGLPARMRRCLQRDSALKIVCVCVRVCVCVGLPAMTRSCLHRAS